MTTTKRKSKLSNGFAEDTTNTHIKEENMHKHKNGKNVKVTTDKALEMNGVNDVVGAVAKPSNITYDASQAGKTLERRLEEMVGKWVDVPAANSKQAPTSSANSSAILLTTALCSNDKHKLNTVLTECAANKSLLRRTIAGVPLDSIDSLVSVLAEHISVGKQNACAHYTCLEMALSVHRRSFTPATLALLAPLQVYITNRAHYKEHVDSVHERLGNFVSDVPVDQDDDEEDEPLAVADLRTRQAPKDVSLSSEGSSEDDLYLSGNEASNADTASTTGSTSSSSGASQLSSIESISALTRALDEDGSDDDGGDDTLFGEHHGEGEDESEEGEQGGEQEDDDEDK